VSDAALVVVGELAPADALTAPYRDAGWEVVELSGSDARGSLSELLGRALDRSAAAALVVLDATLATGTGDARSLIDELVDGPSAVAARILESTGERVAFAGGGIDLETGPTRLDEHAPAAVRHAGAGSTLWFDPRAFAISRAAASLVVSLPIAPELDAFSIGWQIWRAGGSIAMSERVVVRLVGDAPTVATADLELRVVLGSLLDPGTLAASGVRLDGALDRVLGARARLPVARARSDAEILAAIGAPPFSLPAVAQPPVQILHRVSERRRVFILCSDSVGPSMAGPGIRSIELARALADRFDVTVLARRVTGPVDFPGEIGELHRDLILGIASGTDPIVLQGPLTDWFPALLAGTAPIAVDLYDPMNLEALEHPDAATHVPYTTRLLVEQVRRGDFFLCASERQRDYWLGMLAACGRVDVTAYRADPDLRALIDVVPFGLPGEPPVRSGPGPREEIEGIGASDPLFVWNGGLWDWFDPDTLLDATMLARETVPEIRVLFMGVQRPGDSELSPATQALMRRSDELGLTDRNVFFRGWTPYEERHNTYLEATAAVSLHHAHLESRFSFRTRVLDCIWATLPMISTEGDVLAELVRDERLGMTVRPGDHRGVADALVALALDRDGVATRARTQLAQVGPAFRWSSAAAPLATWIERAEPRANAGSAGRRPQFGQEAPISAWLRPRIDRVRGALRARLG
jgi:glycosyltransferase involved in cell wall biosynthesis